MPTLRLPGWPSFPAGALVMTQGRVMKGPPSCGQVVRTGSLVRSTASPLRMTCLQAASDLPMTLGKKLPTSARVGRSLSLSTKLVGVGGVEESADAVGYSVEGVDVEGELHAGLGAELVHEGSGAGVACDVFEQEGGAAGAALRVTLELGGAVCDLGHLEVWADGVLDDGEFAGAVEAGDPFAEVFVGQFPALLACRLDGTRRAGFGWGCGEATVYLPPGRLFVKSSKQGL